MRILLFCLFTCFLNHASAQSILGKWKTFDDKTGEAKALVELYTKEGKVFGRIVEILKEEDKNGTCEQCANSDPRKDKKVLGMTIIRNLKEKSGEWIDGDILDPENGKVYGCKIWLDKDNLMVRGYIGFSLMGRTQVWKRVSN
jgi:uncharacterized protein (DUF2147 family)